MTAPNTWKDDDATLGAAVVVLQQYQQHELAAGVASARANIAGERLVWQALGDGHEVARDPQGAWWQRRIGDPAMTLWAQTDGEVSKRVATLQTILQQKPV